MGRTDTAFRISASPDRVFAALTDPGSDERQSSRDPMRMLAILGSGNPAPRLLLSADASAAAGARAAIAGSSQASTPQVGDEALAGCTEEKPELSPTSTLTPSSPYPWLAIWIRLPHVSSNTAVVTDCISSGSWVNRTPSPRNLSYSALTSPTANEV
jgi:hypothetical protein